MHTVFGLRGVVSVNFVSDNLQLFNWKTSVQPGGDCFPLDLGVEGGLVGWLGCWGDVAAVESRQELQSPRGRWSTGWGFSREDGGAVGGVSLAFQKGFWFTRYKLCSLSLLVDIGKILIARKALHGGVQRTVITLGAYHV
eukprot:TRINITY_DN3981_c0_g2_i1.p2 TRINITY_DN3981_c0_g2~~TRINITY_DN3981_c0_g2_i1.p2  ORF type:complete len:140 (-),score=3.14 TRINITY_DN3981_c0_g2_i1:39-458(-)